MKTKISVFALVACLGLATQLRAQETETRELSSFDEIKLGGSFDVTLRKGSRESVKIESETLALDKIETEVDGNTLKVRLKSGTYRNTGKIRLLITFSDLEALTSSGSSTVVCEDEIEADDFKLECSGSGKIHLAELKASSLDISNSGSGNIEIAGSAQKQSMHLSGSSKIDAFDFQTQESEIHISGSGDVNVNVAESLEASVSGSGDIRYRGNPDVKNIRVSGSGNIRQVD